MTVVYERQINDRACGAAALAMAYRTFGIQIAQEDVWRRLSPDGTGIRTQQIVADARKNGLHALALQARSPWDALRRCIDSSLLVIVNHRPNRSSSLGHFSVVSAIADDYLFLHDPNDGPDRVVPQSRFLEMWSRESYQSQIAGQALVAIGERSTSDDWKCRRCAADIRPTIECSSCRTIYAPEPFAAIGCMRLSCTERTWLRIFCPDCDRPMETFFDVPADFRWTAGLANTCVAMDLAARVPPAARQGE